MTGPPWTFKHVPTGRVVRLETLAGLRHCLASPYWEAMA